MTRFWAESNRQALLGNLIGREIGVENDAAHTFGLFRLCGIPVLCMKHKDFDPLIGSDALLRSRQLLEVERERFGIDHAVLGRRLAVGWNLPRPQADAIGNAGAYANGAREITLANPMEARLAGLGFLIEALSATVAGHTQALQTDDATFAIDTLRLKPADVERIVQRAREGLTAG
jgi:HD-like signal output (HDOD) protein